MKKLKQKVLIISHDASPGGAQNSILNLSKILNSLDFELYIILKKEGGLKEEFDKLGMCFVWNKVNLSNSNIFIKGFNKLINLNQLLNSIILKKINAKSPEICISNTIANHEIVKNFNNQKLKIITWVHELNYMFKVAEKVSLERPKEIIKSTNFFLCASKAVQKHLIDSYKIPIDKTYVLYEIISDQEPKNIVIENICFKVGGCGPIGWRKGSDIFLNLANEIVNVMNLRDISFEWLGSHKDSIGLLQFEEEVKKLNLEKHVIAKPFSNNSTEFMKSINLFLMTSREDPFPLVNLEAGLNKSPILCFSGTGGSEEYALKDNIFKYGDIVSMGKRVKFYKENLSLLAQDAKQSKQNASQFTKQFKTKEVEELIMKLLSYG